MDFQVYTQHQKKYNENCKKVKICNCFPFSCNVKCQVTVVKGILPVALQTHMVRVLTPDTSKDLLVTLRMLGVRSLIDEEPTAFMAHDRAQVDVEGFQMAVQRVFPRECGTAVLTNVPHVVIGGLSGGANLMMLTEILKSAERTKAVPTYERSRVGVFHHMLVVSLFVIECLRAELAFEFAIFVSEMLVLDMEPHGLPRREGLLALRAFQCYP